jgi:hypothetical protein
LASAAAGAVADVGAVAIAYVAPVVFAALAAMFDCAAAAAADKPSQLKQRAAAVLSRLQAVLQMAVEQWLCDAAMPAE